MKDRLFLQDLEHLTDVFGRMSAGTSGRKPTLFVGSRDVEIDIFERD